MTIKQYVECDRCKSNSLQDPKLRLHRISRNIEESEINVFNIDLCHACYQAFFDFVPINTIRSKK